MNNTNKRPVSVAKAHYSDTFVSEHQSNPLILALPERAAPKRMRQLLSVTVSNFDWTHLSKSDREERVRSIRNTRVMTNQHLDLYYDVYDMLRYGYVHRNPTVPQVVAWSYDVADSTIPLAEVDKPSIDASAKPTTADAIFLTGFSGNGKSTMTEHLLFNLFPQVIEHDWTGFNEPQVVYLKVDLPHNATRTGLIERLLLELDRVLFHTSFGLPHYAKSVKTKGGKYIDVESMVDILVTVLIRHHVGLVVIDEFQNLQVASQRYRLEVIQLFDELANRLYIPSIKIGTPDTIHIFDRNSRHKRRLGKPFELNRFSDDKAWERAMAALFAFQPLDHPIPRDKAIEALLMKLTAGVPAYLFGLWEEGIIEAIRSGKERLSQTLLNKAFKQRFPLLRSATRNINQGKKGRHTDLFTVQQYLDTGSNTVALKHLSLFAQQVEASGAAAEDVLKDIDEAVDTVDFSPGQHKQLDKIKQTLRQKKNQLLGPQTIEHKS
jgi:hypothetical protein